MPFWNGRFRKPLDPAALSFSASLPVDKRLYREDIRGSLAHVSMLARKRVIPSRDAAKIRKALREILRELEAGSFPWPSVVLGRFVAEDIHMAIEQRLIRKVGAIGGKLHTGRSRNDQIALDERLYLRDTIAKVLKDIRGMQKVLLRKGEAYQTLIMPGYTHLQQAQPILLAHHLLAYIAMLDRDRERFADCLRRVNRSPLGAGALAGTSLPIDRGMTARMLKFDAVLENSLDAVSDRDVLIEFVAACAITMMHLSRLAEEMVLWSSQEWGFAEIGDTMTTGSSMMPHKKNPDMAELVRGKTGRVYGDLMALLTMMKGLPLAYNRDMQEDKPPLFDAAETLSDSLNIFARMMQLTRFNEKRFSDDWRTDLMLATDLAEYLVRKNMPFRKAHAVVGRIVASSLARKRSLRSLPIAEYRKYTPLFRPDLFEVLDPRRSIRLKRSAGSTSPAEVGKALGSWKRKLVR